MDADAPSADAALEESSQHLDSARTIADTDPHGAYQLAYDAARKHLELNPDNPRALYMGAAALVQLGERDKAAARLAEAELFP